MPRLAQYDYIFGIGTVFALLDAYNNGANDVANSWATSVSSRSIPYRWAMVLGTIFEMVGAITVGARSASTIKGGIIPLDALQDNPGVQMLAFTCALAGSSIWVMWCSIHSTHVSSTYSLISALAGVGVAVVGADQVQWGWNKGSGLGAIFAGLALAPLIAAGFGIVIFMLIKVVVHMRKNPVVVAVYTSPFWFFVAATICTLNVVYKGSPNLGLADKPVWYIMAVTFGTSGGVALLAAIFFVPFLHQLIIKQDGSLRWWHVFYGPLLWSRQAPGEASGPLVPDYSVDQDDKEMAMDSDSDSTSKEGQPEIPVNAGDVATTEKALVQNEARHVTQKELVAEANDRFHAKLRKGRGPLAWAMRTLHNNPMGAGEIYELKNLRILAIRLPAIIVVALLYGLFYDIHAAQIGVAGTPDGARMARVYSHAVRYPNEVEHTYSFVQIITACTASFAHGSNDIGNSAAPWAAIYSAWKTGMPVEKKAAIPVWQLAVLSATLSLGLVTYGFNIMRVMGNKITYHSPSRGASMELAAAVTILIFSQYKLPVSTSMCITGATVGVGLCNGTYKAVNWQRIALLLTGWILTIPIAGTLAGCIMGVLLNTPHFN